MSYKIFLFDALDAVQWSQVAWKLEGRKVSLDDCKRELIHDVLLGNLPKEGRIVDAGCGVARWPIYLRRLGYDVFGLEYDHGACVIARENDAGLAVLQSDVRRAPLKDASVDAVISLGVVEHEEVGPLEALREARRILRPNGVMVIAVPYNNPWRRVFMNHVQSYITRKRRRANWKLGFAEYRFSKGEMTHFLDQAGFDVVSSHPNDLEPPKNMGLWVDYNNVVMNPFRQLPVEELFILPGIKGRVAAALTRWFPWLVCGEVVFVARPRGI
jgi:SAM-dependent methyltransferase